MSLSDNAKNDIIDFLNRNNELLFNERDFQMHLSVALRENGHYDDVDIEYYVPFEQLENYIWKNELRLDIVVRKGNEYLPIELKYKTRKAKRTILRFNEQIQDIEVLKNQGAQDLGMYDFWKDVRRIELVRKRFAKVHNGLAVFVTNDAQYTRPSKPTSNNHLFNMDNGVHGKTKHWSDKNSTSCKKHPDFEVEKEYVVEWLTTRFEDVEFHYCIVSI